MSRVLSLAQPVIGEAEKNAVARVIDSGWITMGENVRKFEKAFAALHQKDDAVAVNSCTSGLHLALVSLGIGDGDEVLLPSLTFVATVNSVKYVGATPVFVDIPLLTQPHISIEQADELVTGKTRAVVIMHYGGYLADVSAWRKFADKHDLFLIEDAAHAPGCVNVGTFADVCSFSFFSNKNMTTSEGGMLIANKPELLEHLRLLRSHGMTSLTLDRHKGHAYSYDVVDLGYNYRLDELRAAIGIEQLKELPNWNRRRINLSLIYRELFEKASSEIIVPFTGDDTTSAHLMPILLPENTNRQSVMDYLRSHSIQSSIHYPAAHKFSYYKKSFPDVVLPVTEEFCSRELSLPLHPLLSEQDIAIIVSTLEQALIV